MTSSTQMFWVSLVMVARVLCSWSKEKRKDSLKNEKERGPIVNHVQSMREWIGNTPLWLVHYDWYIYVVASKIGLKNENIRITVIKNNYTEGKSQVSIIKWTDKLLRFF